MDSLSYQVGQYLQQHNLLLATAESCTAGLISSTLAQTPGSSCWLDSGFIVYSAHAKNQMLGVSLDTIEKYNITSCEVAKEMSHGAIKKSKANSAVSITGLAGPSGGSLEIPVGTVCMSWAFLKDNQISSFEEKKLFEGDRNTIREKAAQYILEKIEYYYTQNYYTQNYHTQLIKKNKI